MATRSRRLSARRASDYNNEIHGRRESSTPPGDLTLNEGFSVHLMRPRWKDGPIVYRPLPPLDYASPETNLLSGRQSTDDRGFTEWTVRVEVASYVGHEGQALTWNLRRPADKAARATNPYRIFYNACKAAFDGGRFASNRRWDSDWNPLMKGSKNGGAALSPPTIKWFTQAAVYQNGDKVYVDGDRSKPLGLDAKDDLVVVQSSLGAGERLLGLFAERLDEYDGDPETDFNAPFVHGDPVGVFLAKKRVVKGGRICILFNPSKTKPKGLCPDYHSWDGKIADTQGWEAGLATEWEYNGEVYKPRLDSDDVQTVFDKGQFWWDNPDNDAEKGLLRFAPEEQQTVWIAQAFSKTPKLVTFAFSDHAELLTDEVKGILNARVSALVPGADGDEDEEDAKPARNGKSKSKKDLSQSSLKFKDEDEDEDEDEDDKSARSKAKSKAKSRRVEEDDDEDDEDDEDDAPKAKSKAKSRRVEEDDEDDEDEDEEEAKPKPKSKAKGRVEEDDEDDDEDEDDEAETESAEDDEEDEDDEDDEEDAKPVAKAKSKAKSRRVEEDEDDDEDDEDDEDEDDDEPVKPAAKSKAAAKPAAKPKAAVIEEDEDEDEEEAKPAKASKNGKAKAKAEVADEDDEDEDEDDEEEAKPKSKAAAKPAKNGKAKPVEEDDEEDDEDDEDDDEDEEEAKPVKGGKASKNGKAKTLSDDEIFDVDPKPAMKKSMDAAKAAKTRSAARSEAPKAPKPAPPKSKGGSAGRKGK